MHFHGYLNGSFSVNKHLSSTPKNIMESTKKLSFESPNYYYLSLLQWETNGTMPLYWWKEVYYLATSWSNGERVRKQTEETITT